MNKKFLKLSILLALAILVTSACSIVTVDRPGASGSTVKIGVGASGGSGANTSVFFSTNSGNSWRPVDAVPTTNGQKVSLNGLNVKVLRSDPEDSAAVYLASASNGLYYTYNINKGWNQVSSLPALKINDVQVSPKDKCLIYAAASSSLYRSNDCTRTWTQVYVDGNNAVKVNTIAIDFRNPNNIYIGTSAGQILKSIDAGHSWRNIHTLSGPVARLLISPLNSGLLFVATTNNKVYSFSSNSHTNSNDPTNIDQNFSIDNWRDFNAALASYHITGQFRNLIINPANGAIYLATSQMIFRSGDQGSSWSKLNLLQSSSASPIRDIAADPKNPLNIYYVTAKGFFSSTDGGVTWKVQSLPSGRNGQTILIDASNPKNIYLGTTLASK